MVLVFAGRADVVTEHVHSIVAAGAAALIFAKWLTQLGLERLNQRELRAHADAVPGAFRDLVDPVTYARSTQYSLARSRLSQAEATCDAVVLSFVLFSGVLPWAFNRFAGAFGSSAWAMAAFLFLSGVALAVPGLPLNWYEQFRIETRFGFNTMTGRLWWLDRLKVFLLSLGLGYPLLVLILKLVDWTGARWWLWGWACLTGFQLLLTLVAPGLILPLFNQFTPLPDGRLRERLLALARRTGFRAKSIQVMDGSRRSRHSNAFFTGLGRARKIVLFDTLIQQLNEAELESVLAHEIGHYRRRHVAKLLLVSAAGTLFGFLGLAALADQAWFYRAFGFESQSVGVALLLFSLLGGVVSFWASPLIHGWTRRHEYEADAFAAATMHESGSLIAALRRLSVENLSNLTPHPLYSGFHYSHPTLLERERALRTLPLGSGPLPS
jgi:STE24 endopeptidase